MTRLAASIVWPHPSHAAATHHRARECQVTCRPTVFASSWSQARVQGESTTMGTLSQADEAQLKAQLQDAVVAATERCLYHSAKWCVARVPLPSAVC